MDFTQSTVTEINEASHNPESFIRTSENRYKNEVYDVAVRIADNDKIKIVALAGPSGSGKTSTAHILCEKLKELGETPTVVSLDDFYLSDKDLPLLPNGEKDIESVNSLNIPLINECFNEIIATGKTVLPKFDFANKRSIRKGREVDISNHGIIIVEGLHALNPLIADLVPRENIFKAYISVNCSILDRFGEQLLSSRQIRLVRRVLRDRIYRGCGVKETLKMWNGVVEGERKYLYCFKNTADVLIRTLHHFEPCIYRDLFLPLKNLVTPDTECYEYFMRTVNSLEKFESIDSSLLPHNSLIREFVGNGKYN